MLNQVTPTGGNSLQLHSPKPKQLLLPGANHQQKMHKEVCVCVRACVHVKQSLKQTQQLQSHVRLTSATSFIINTLLILIFFKIGFKIEINRPQGQCQT